MTRIRNIALGAAAALALSALAAGPVAACGDDADMTHFGVVMALDGEAGTLTLLDAGTGKLLVFQVTPAQLRSVAGVTDEDQVAIRYAEENGRLVAEEIRV